MREISLRVPADAVEDVLDDLLPLVPNGVRELADGDQVELCLRGRDLPERAAVLRAAGPWLLALQEREVPDDWRERRLADYRPLVIGGRLLVRPRWAPPAGPGLLEVELGDSPAFGSGSHPTTRHCLELLCDLQPRGGFADLGCGSGVLAVAAARLGWTPVIALDHDLDAVAATRANALSNGVAIDVRLADLEREPPPAAHTVAANFPVALHGPMAERMSEALPRVLVASGFLEADEHDALSGYRARGMHERRRVVDRGWVVVVFEAA
jgi:ribosomal protein L11 methyltransferase